MISEEKATLSLLNDLSVSDSSTLECFETHNGLKCLSIESFGSPPIPDQLFGEQLQQITILRIPYTSDTALVDSFRKLPNLVCLEIIVSDDFDKPRRGDLLDRISAFMFPGLIEFAVIVNVFERERSITNTIKSCINNGRLVSIAVLGGKLRLIPPSAAFLSTSLHGRMQTDACHTPCLQV